MQNFKQMITESNQGLFSKVLPNTDEVGVWIILAMMLIKLIK